MLSIRTEPSMAPARPAVYHRAPVTMSPYLAAIINRVHLLGLENARAHDADALAVLEGGGLIVGGEPTEDALDQLAEYETDVIFDVFWTTTTGEVGHAHLLLPPYSTLGEVLVAAAPMIGDGRCHDVQGPDGGWIAGERGASFDEAEASEIVYTPWAEQEPTTVVLVACSAGKVEHTTGAMLLYNGPMFTMRSRWAVRHHGLVAGILSGKHGLLSPTELVAPYDLALPKKRAAARRAWARRTAKQIASTFHTGTVVIVRGGVDYGAVADYLPGWTIRRPRYRGIGYERQALKRETEPGREPQRSKP